MLVVRVEVWPGGRAAQRYEVGRLKVGNVTALADESDYVYAFDGDAGGGRGRVNGHVRRDGAWALVRRVLEQDHG